MGIVYEDIDKAGDLKALMKPAGFSMRYNYAVGNWERIPSNLQQFNTQIEQVELTHA